MSNLQLSVPMLHVDDMDRALGFYRDQLGFSVRSEYRSGGEALDPAYVVVGRDATGLHLSSFSGDGRPGGVAMIYVRQVDTLHAEFKSRGVDVSDGPHDQTWGNREFYLRDPFGNQLRFAQPARSPSHSSGRPPTRVDQPMRVEAAGSPPKQIEEFVGLANTETQTVSIARMTSPHGWSEPGQRPTFQEMSVVLKGELHIEHEHGVLKVKSGQAAITHPDQWVRYATPTPEGAEYISVCVPAFSLDEVHRDPE